MKKIAVFASGGGTDFQSIIDANAKEKFCEIKYLVASKPEIGSIERAKRAGIEVLVYDKSVYANITEFYQAVTQILSENGVDYLVLAGWLLIIPQSFIQNFEDRIVNIHPALLPSFGGKGYYGLNVHKAVLAYGAKLSGATVHFVEADVDGGAIIMQKSVEVKFNDTPESLQERVLEVEHQILPLCVKLLCEGKVVKSGRQVRVLEN